MALLPILEAIFVLAEQKTFQIRRMQYRVGIRPTRLPLCCANLFFLSPSIELFSTVSHQVSRLRLLKEWDFEIHRLTEHPELERTHKDHRVQVLISLIQINLQCIHLMLRLLILREAHGNTRWPVFISKLGPHTLAADQELSLAAILVPSTPAAGWGNTAQPRTGETFKHFCNSSAEDSSALRKLAPIYLQTPHVVKVQRHTARFPLISFLHQAAPQLCLGLLAQGTAVHAFFPTVFCKVGRKQSKTRWHNRERGQGLQYFPQNAHTQKAISTKFGLPSPLVR